MKRFSPMHYYFIIALAAGSFLSCATVQRSKVLDRSVTPEVKADVPAHHSEIREITFHGLGEEKGHKDLHLLGQLFKKAEGSGQISPCSGCLVSFSNPADSTVKATMVTEKDGFFEFDGKLLFNTITVSAPEHNKLELSNVSFDHGGITTMRLILAPGSGTERFVLNKNAKIFSWSRL
ncbi:MAG TPA: hypothetical protein VM843_03085 [Flavisolibacter sp.]|nr:hypothetical protein [Flavisolibacter sp.]